MTVVVFYANRNVIFEQRSAISQARNTQAFEVAEAGMEWVIGMLNTPTEVDGNCVANSSGTRFRVTYLAPNITTFAPTNGVPGCKMINGAWSCKCPSGTSTNLSATSGPSFTASFAAVAGYTNVVQVTVTGCTENTGTGVCAATGTGAPDGTAVITAQLKVSPLLPARAPAPIVCGGNCAIGGSFSVINQSVETNGILVNAGGTITSGNGTSYTTLPGQPAQNALVGSDSSLSSLASSDATCSNSSMFRTFFGTTIEEYKNQPQVKTISCGSANDCSSQIQTAYAAGDRNFYFSSDVHLSGNVTLNNVSNPVVFVTPNGLTINGNWTIYGVIFSNSSDFNDIGTGNSSIYGAIVSCNAYNNNGNGLVSYNEDVFGNINILGGTLVKIPGSWKDWN
ncbi:hypothetical protein I7X43_16020 [Inhella sp. 4Y17]|uniref:Uncharacterized protein n=2 Tax=Inhella gelatinilytica TaxID=2795030 RepID=A0A931IY76_9BURK|nr:hypothetical protein [Inhella gelatinilytica]MBH9554349.1 hypothetical protein [Inhella gelatinilytica]